MLRRIGIILFFALTFLAQLLFLYQLSQSRTTLTVMEEKVLRWQKIMAALLMAIGISTVILDLTYRDYDSIEDAFEWVMMLFIVTQFCSHYWLWREEDLRVEVKRGPD